MDEAEAIRVLSEIIDRYEKTNDTQDIYGWGIVALGVAIEALRTQQNSKSIKMHSPHGRLIDADELLRPCHRFYIGDEFERFGYEVISTSTVRNAHTIVDARKVGKWINDGESKYCKCSECGSKPGFFGSSYGLNVSEWLSDYCPNCGTQMIDK